MERTLGYIIGATVALGLLLGLALLFGGVFISAVSALVAFPVAAPMTTTALIVVFAAAYVAFRKKRRKEARERRKE